MAEAPYQQVNVAEEHRFPCEQCGADYRFAPDQGELLCDYCGNQVEISDDENALKGISELDFRSAMDAQLPQAEIVETRVLQCPNCAAKFEFDAAIHAADCPFCATPVVTDTGVLRQIKPKAVLPFAMDERAARDALANWLGGLWFAPNGVRQYTRKGRKLQGIYVPYWTYDAQTKSRYFGQRGTVYYVTRRIGDKTRRVSKIRWHAVSGRVSRFFNDVLVLASKSLPKKFTDALGPWDLSALEPYQPEYLAGFRAEGYTVVLADGYNQARAHMDRVIVRDVKFDIGGDRQRVSSVDTDISQVTFKHILLPVWMAAYKYRGQSFRFVINGRTGRVQGQRPYSMVKIAFAVVLGVIVAGTVGYFIAINQ